MRIRGGYAALYSSAAVFSFTTLAVKLASRRYSSETVSASRFAIGAALCLAVLALGYRSLKPAHPAYVALRGVFGAASMAASYAAIALTGPGRATVLSNTYPLFVALIGALLFGERLEPRLLASIAACTGGAILVVRDGSGASLAGDLLALGSAVAAGFAVNFLRRAARDDNPFMLYLSPCALGLPLALLAARGSGDRLADGGPVGIALLVGAGILAFAAQALMSLGYRSVQAGKGSVVFYLETALTVLLGVLVAGETFNARCLAGLALIIVGLVLNQLGLGRRRGPAPPPLE